MSTKLKIVIPPKTYIQRVGCNCVYSVQTKNLFCKTLAACLGMKPHAEPVQLKCEGSMSNDGDHHDHPAAISSSLPKAEKKPTGEQLENRAQDEEEQKIEWKLAASVLDRICAIIFTVVFLAGNVIFFIIFTHHP